MNIENTLQNDWNFLTSFLPRGWQELAKEKKAVVRPLRSFDSVDSMLRGLMLHIGRGYSLKETSARLKASKITNISDVGILDALRKSEYWLQELCYRLYFEQEGFSLPTQNLGNKKVRLIDGTIVREPGKTGSQWRINYSITMPELRCNYFDLVSAKGKGNGESIRRYPIEANECIIADRGYSRIEDIFYVKANNSDMIVRVNHRMLPLYKEDDSRFDLELNLKELEKSGDIKDFRIYIKNDQGEKLYGRICAIRKSRESTRISVKKIKHKACKNSREVSEESLELAKYIIIFTTLDQTYSPQLILDWYRIRWQIELAFKRLKSLAGLGHLPKYSDASSRAWLYGKLLIGLLADKILRVTKTISPWGYSL